MEKSRGHCVEKGQPYDKNDSFRKMFDQVLLSPY